VNVAVVPSDITISLHYDDSNGSCPSALKFKYPGVLTMKTSRDVFVYLKFFKEISIGDNEELMNMHFLTCGSGKGDKRFATKVN
jgi:hypothetical protein